MSKLIYHQNNTKVYREGSNVRILYTNSEGVTLYRTLNGLSDEEVLASLDDIVDDMRMAYN